MLKINKKNTAIISALIITNILLALVWSYFYFKIKEGGDRILELRKEIQIIQKNKEENKSLEALIGNIEGDKNKIDKIFINEKEIINFIEEIEGLASQSNVSLDIISAKIPDFNFNVNGNFDSIFKFLVSLENMPYRIVLNRVFLQKNEGSGKWEIDFTILLTSYKND